MNEDSILIKKCKRGSVKHQNILYDKYKRLVMGVCLRYCKNRSDAEDIHQESFVKIFGSLNRSNKIESLRQWITRITINTAINYYHKSLSKPETNKVELIETADDEYLEIIDRLQTEVLLDLIKILPYEYQLVFNMHAIDGYSHREIGETLSIPENTSRSHLHRAKNLLKTHLLNIGYVKYEAI